MAVADEKTKLKLTIGSVIHYLPLYDDFSDFYNKEFLKVTAFNKTLYAPLSKTYSNSVLNAGVERNGKKYYFLTRAFKGTETFSSNTSFLNTLQNNNILNDKVVLTTDCEIPDSGVYLLDFSVDASFGVYQLYGELDNAFVGKLTVRQCEQEILTTNVDPRTDTYYPPDTTLDYVHQGLTRGDYTESMLLPYIKPLPLGKAIIPLSAGKFKFELSFNVQNVTHHTLGTLLKAFKVVATHTGFKNMQTITSDTSWKLPMDWDNTVRVLLYGAGGGGGGGKRYLRYVGDTGHKRYSNFCGGKGGDGELIDEILNIDPSQIYTITLGTGGTGGNFVDTQNDKLQAENGTKGNTSQAFNYKALGGDGGGGATNSTNPDIHNGKSYGEGSKGGKGGRGVFKGLNGSNGKVVILYNLKGEV